MVKVRINVGGRPIAVDNTLDGAKDFCVKYARKWAEWVIERRYSFLDTNTCQTLDEAARINAMSDAELREQIEVVKYYDD